jgi:hypothetical protein
MSWLLNYHRYNFYGEIKNFVPCELFYIPLSVVLTKLAIVMGGAPNIQCMNVRIYFTFMLSVHNFMHKY